MRNTGLNGPTDHIVGEFLPPKPQPVKDARIPVMRLSATGKSRNLGLCGGFRHDSGLLMDCLHRRIFISSISAAAGATRQPMQNSMNSATPIRRLPDSPLEVHFRCDSDDPHPTIGSS
jgi:hypothetical protein